VKRIRISTAEHISNQKPPGYMDALRAVGIPAESGMLHVSDEDYADIAVRFPTSYRHPPQRTTAIPRSPLPSEPTLAELTTTFSTAVARWAVSGFRVVDEPSYVARSAACDACPFWDATARLGLGKCNSPGCGCTKLKRYLATEKCPQGKWPTA